MSQYTSSIAGLRTKMETNNSLVAKIDALAVKSEHDSKNIAIMIEAQQLLSAVSESNTNHVLDYITGIINKTLGEMFPYDKPAVELEKTIFSGKYPHVNVRLITEEGRVRNIKTQCGTGVRQVVSFLFLVCLIELRKGRRILIMDEIMSGLHASAKEVIMGIMSIFAETGFQFIFVEHYGMFNFGKQYLVEKPNKEAIATHIEDTYNGEIFRFHNPENAPIIDNGDDAQDEDMSKPPQIVE